eukprot:CAMPEP_0178376596 /NCGR_PEP_ID=MMETSP0689_2-20121128/3484_1 /TAXON_ID=160604 /ORGANISM="Amphidinium massartii, Strain CS-259" /LENGTH=114 /DNA_ID=CAMNT_0019996623 /DNA_START=601 /DNA_END=945 /DNA_ORIENTATION=-
MVNVDEDAVYAPLQEDLLRPPPSVWDYPSHRRQMNALLFLQNLQRSRNSTKLNDLQLQERYKHHTLVGFPQELQHLIEALPSLPQSDVRLHCIDGGHEKNANRHRYAFVRPRRK